jgi:hypothetical protein
MSSSRSEPLKAAWDRARAYAAEHGLSLRKARSILAQQPKPAKPKRSTKRSSKTAGVPPELAAAEKQLRAKYPHVIAGTMAAHSNGLHKGRRIVEIQCQTKGCKNRRLVHTSDLFQVNRCVECTLAARSQRRSKSKGTS